MVHLMKQSVNNPKHLLIKDVRFIQRVKMKPYINILLSLTMIGCASNPGGYKSEESVERKLMSLTEQEVVLNLGAPSKQVTTSSGAVAWTYRDEANGLTGGKCTISLVIKKGKVLSASVTAKDRSWVSFPLGSCENILGNFK